MKKIIILLNILILTACSVTEKTNNNITYQSKKITLTTLLNEMVDFRKLMETPVPNYKCIQFSSYDRHSTNVSLKTTSGWFANSDIGKYIRVETNNGRVEYVMADVDGPGAIVRMWTANSPHTIRVYFDNSDEPEIKMDEKEMFFGKNKLFPEPISGVRGIGKNSYMPIPFAKHCKITTSAKMLYYHVNCRVYEKNADVETFTLAQLKEESNLVEKIVKILKAPEKLTTNPGNYDSMSGTNTLIAGASFSISDDSKNKAVYAFECKILKGDLKETLRKCLLEISFDNMTKPAVQAPLGDFFGTVPGLNKYRSLPLGVLDDGTMYCHFLMPYKKNCEIKFINTTTNEIKFTYKILIKPCKWTERTQYFYAKWKAWSDYPTRPQSDLNLFACSGKGKYVGNMFQISNPTPNWWGEGDEKVYIDDEKFPSTFGTGTEDYYGFAYCWWEPFTHAYHNQVHVDGPANYGHSCVSRFHFLDALTFNKSIKFDIEVWHHADTNISLATTIYWYQRPGAKDNFKPVKKEQLTFLEIQKIKKKPGAIEGEEMKVLKVSGGKTSTKITGKNCVDQNKTIEDGSVLYPTLVAGWHSAIRSCGRALWWIDFKKGDKLVLEFDSDKAGTNEVLYSGTRGRIFGSFDIYINNRPAKKPIDLFSKKVTPTGEINLGQFFIKKGKNTIKIVAKDKKKKTELFVLDYLKIKKPEQKKKITHRDIFPDTWVGIDDLGRNVPDWQKVGLVKTNGEHAVGIFYVTWHGDSYYKTKSPYSGDVSKILKKDPEARFDAKNKLWQY
ncbi:DUF2961 domain-containing protein, partial [bacterium]|nr:DUF2961 domain-containing protein [bacterium]